jgi:hypothetical protein
METDIRNVLYQRGYPQKTFQDLYGGSYDLWLTFSQDNIPTNCAGGDAEYDIRNDMIRTLPYDPKARFKNIEDKFSLNSLAVPSRDQRNDLNFFNEVSSGFHFN